MDKLTVKWQNFTRVGLQTQVCFQNTAVSLLALGSIYKCYSNKIILLKFFS